MENKFLKITTDTLAAGAPIALGALLGNPVSAMPAALISSIVKNGAQACMNTIHDDMKQRQLSKMQITRSELVLHYAQKAYFEMIEKQGWKLVHPESAEYVNAHLEACEHMVVNAINESQSKKIPFEGFLFATKYNSTDMNFDDFHMMANILFKMTWREIVLTHIFKEGLDSKLCELYVTNPAACVEVYDLVSWGLVKPDEGWVIENNSEPVCLKDITITDFGKKFTSALLTEKITEEEKVKILSTLELAPIERDEPVNRNHSLKWKRIGKIEDGLDTEKIVREGLAKIDYKDSDQAMFDYDVARGK